MTTFLLPIRDEFLIFRCKYLKKSKSFIHCKNGISRKKSSYKIL